MFIKRFSDSLLPWLAELSLLLSIGLTPCVHAAVQKKDYFCAEGRELSAGMGGSLRELLVSAAGNVYREHVFYLDANTPKTLGSLFAYINSNGSEASPGALLASGYINGAFSPDTISPLWVDVYAIENPNDPASATRIDGYFWISRAAFCFKSVIAQPTVVIGFFNGVSNTRSAAQGSLRRLEAEFGPQYKETPLKYAQFYNQTACDGGFCWEDMAETFEQRSMALNGVFADRWETFWDILAGRHQQDTSLTGRLLNLLGNGSNALLQWLDTTATAVLNQLVNNTLRLMTYFSNSPTAADRADHNTRLWRYADDGNQLLLVAHSQGNLFVNSAYDALMRFKPEAKARVVHVAPAAPTLRGDHVLADIDLVINALRGTGLSSVPDVNINLPLSKIDLTGHSFEPTYLDKSRAAYARTRGMITNSLDALTQ